jgi:glutamate-1-semialdehyde 2,1-aminomutase
MPIGAYGGRADIMDMIAPQGEVYQAGTLSGNPVAVSAGLTTLQLLSSQSFYADLEQKTGYLVNGLFEKAREAKVPVRINAVGSMMTVFFCEQPVRDMASASKMNSNRFAKFWRKMLEEGVYLPPSAYEAWFISNAHTERDIDVTIRAAGEAFKAASVV